MRVLIIFQSERRGTSRKETYGPAPTINRSRIVSDLEEFIFGYAFSCILDENDFDVSSCTFIAGSREIIIEVRCVVLNLVTLALFHFFLRNSFLVMLLVVFWMKMILMSLYCGVSRNKY